MSNIEWTEKTWNPTVGCSKVSAGCANCYAAEMAHRLDSMGGNGRLAYYSGLTEKRGDRVEWTGKVSFVPEALEIPLKRKKPTVWFVNSVSDLFHENVSDEQIDQIFAVMALTPHHTYQILTKRPERMYKYFSDLSERTIKVINLLPQWIGVGMDYVGKGLTKGIGERNDFFPLPNVWLGVSVENQKAADDRIPWLARTPAAKRFLSCEPLLGEVILCSDDVTLNFAKQEKRSTDYEFLHDIDWVIVGAESGHNVRPMNEDWVRSIRDQCIASNTAFFYKQDFIKGKKVSLPKLDGRTWAEMPN